MSTARRHKAEDDSGLDPKPEALPSFIFGPFIQVAAAPKNSMDGTRKSTSKSSSTLCGPKGPNSLTLEPPQIALNNP